MLYFLKGNIIHRYPVPKRCPTKYQDEPLTDLVRHGTEECVYCMHRWPEDESDIGVS